MKRARAYSSLWSMLINRNTAMYCYSVAVFYMLLLFLFPKLVCDCMCTFINVCVCVCVRVCVCVFYLCCINLLIAFHSACYGCCCSTHTLVWIPHFVVLEKEKGFISLVPCSSRFNNLVIAFVGY